jgi:hypothetical protein
MKPPIDVITPEAYDSMFPLSWYKEMDDSFLSGQRAFLGWAPSAVVLVGTFRSNTAIEPSRLPEIPKAKFLLTRGGGISAGFKSIAISVTGKFKTPILNISHLVAHLLSPNKGKS